MKAKMMKVKMKKRREKTREKGMLVAWDARMTAAASAVLSSSLAVECPSCCSHQ